LKVIDWENLGELSRGGSSIAAAVGVFDGLHIGHRALIKRVLGRSGLASAVVTFKENPKLILSPSTFHGDLSTLDQRLELIESMGADFCVLIDFSGDFSKLPGRHFLSALADRGALRYLAVGSDFRCGHHLDTDARGIRAFCGERSIGVELLDAVGYAGHPVSSSRIRKAVLEGRLDDAASMLGRPYELDLRSTAYSGDGRFSLAGSQALPPAGAYEACLASRGGFGGERLVARLGSDGFWLMGAGASEGLAPTGLRLLSLVSRE
jgi:riboflavin kinase / FMN adenylyltransferase